MTAFHKFVLSKTSGVAVPTALQPAEPTIPVQPKKQASVVSKPAEAPILAAQPVVKTNVVEPVKDQRPDRPALVIGPPASEPAPCQNCEAGSSRSRWPRSSARRRRRENRGCSTLARTITRRRSRSRRPTRSPEQCRRRTLCFLAMELALQIRLWGSLTIPSAFKTHHRF